MGAYVSSNDVSGVDVGKFNPRGLEVPREVHGHVGEATGEGAAPARRATKTGSTQTTACPERSLTD